MVWTSAAVALGTASGLACVLRFLASAPVPKRNAEKRAKLVSQRLLRSLKEDFTFDQLLSGLELEEVRGDGLVRGSMLVSGPMLSKEQQLHEGGLMCLLDDLTSLAVWVRATWPGVSVEMHCTVLAPARAGERLVAEARVQRIGSTLAFSSFELRRAGEGGELIAVGGQTKHVGLPFFTRVLQGIGSLHLPFGTWLTDQATAKSRRALEDAVKAGKLPPLQKIQDPSLEPALGLSPQAADGGAPPSTFGFFSQLHLLNGYWGGHGASSAALFAEAVRQHLGAAGARVAEIRCSYMTPVPPFKGLGVVVTPLPAPEAGSGRHFLAEIRNEQGHVFVRGGVTVTMA